MHGKRHEFVGAELLNTSAPDRALDGGVARPREPLLQVLGELVRSLLLGPATERPGSADVVGDDLVGGAGAAHRQRRQ